MLCLTEMLLLIVPSSVLLVTGSVKARCFQDCGPWTGGNV